MFQYITHMHFKYMFSSQDLGFKSCSIVHITYKVTEGSSAVKSSTGTLDDFLASFSHGADQLCFGWVLGYSFQNLGLPGGEGVPPCLHLPEFFLCPCPDMLLWVEVWRVARPTLLHCDLACLKGSFGWSGME